MSGRREHPYLQLLRDAPLRALWTGLTVSAVGSELYRVGAIWLAAQIAGPDAALLVTAQSAAMLAVSILAGPAVEALPRRVLLIGSDVASAVIAGAVVIATLGAGLSFPLLVAASVLLSAMGVVARPVFLSSLPVLAPGRVREANGLFDSSVRVAQAAGPFLAAAMLKISPPIHLLTANALSFLISAAAIAGLGLRLEQTRVQVGAAEDLLGRLGRGVRAANGCPGAWTTLVATGVRGGAYALGYTVAIPLLFSRADAGLPGLAIVLGVGAVTEIISTPLLVLTRPARPLARMFEGYLLIGAGLSAMGAMALAFSDATTPMLIGAMACASAVIGLGNSMAGLQMMTFFATRLVGDDHAAALRLRYVTIIGAIMAATAAGPLVLRALGPAWTIMACGAVAALAGGWGLSRRPARRYGPGFEML